ncbi:MAG: flagellar basal body L-ring protein FlgH [Magnetococcus sp. DMHC-6]
MDKNAMGVILILTSVGLSGCGMTRAAERPIEPIQIVRPQPPELLAPKKGSIWQTTDRNTLFLDTKARNVGDIITVNVQETSDASREATTKLSRDNTDGFTLSGMFGLAGIYNKLFSNDTKNNITSNHSYDGSGKTDGKSDFKTTITCAVTEVLANGNLRIEGRRDITINNENQFILLSGIIRPEDISAGNAVASTQIADARIEYSGDGSVAQQQNPSWINSVFSQVPVL